MSKTNRNGLRAMTRGAYDIQKLRIEMGNRVVANWKAKRGQAPGEKEEEIDEDAKAILDSLRENYSRITDGMVKLPKLKDFEGDEVISDYVELCLVDQYVKLLVRETEHFRQLETVLKDFPIWTEFLQGVRGCGPAMASVIVSEFDITKARYASSLWRYAGLDVAADGRGRSRRKEHLQEVEYTDKDGKPTTKQGITFNPWLKTKLVGVLGTCFLRSGGPYREVYDAYKVRLENHAKYGLTTDTSKLHRHNMAIRYMVKRFLADLYVAWRTLENLPVEQEYSEAKLGRTHAA